MFWNYNKYFNHLIPKEFQLQGYNGETPVYKLESSMSNVFIKDEGVNITGTHKDRSFRYWISLLKERGVKKAVISSSGSAARSAEHFCKDAGIELEIFTKERTKTPKKEAVIFSRDFEAINLRSSTDENAIEGYKTIAFELAKKLPDIEEIFLPVSSGAALLGIHEGYKILSKEKNVSIPRLYIVQTTRVHPMAEVFDQDFTEEESHAAKAIVDKIANRKDGVIDAVTKSRGGGYVISNKELEESISTHAPHLQKTPGNESFLTLAALKKHRKLNAEYIGAKSVCIFTS